MSVGTDSDPAPRHDTVRIGEWTVEPALNQLSSTGRTVRIEPKAMAVLMFLEDRAGQVVSREALLAAVWPGVVVGDDSLTQVIIKLRKALGDVPEKPAYIQTISKGGYRLLAPVVRAEKTTSSFAAPDPESLVAHNQRRIPIAVAGIAVLVLTATGIWWSTREPVAVAPDQVTTSNTDAARAAPPTVIVRPFEALSDDPQATLLARGITEDLVTDLSKVLGLRVITVAPMAAPVGTDVATDAASSRYLVTGSVQRSADRLRLHVRLIDTETGKQVWSERFDRALNDLFAIQDELGPAILQILPAKVSEAELRRVAQRHTRNLEAYEYFQRGQAELLVRQQAANETARDMFRPSSI